METRITKPSDLGVKCGVDRAVLMDVDYNPAHLPLLWGLIKHEGMKV